MGSEVLSRASPEPEINVPPTADRMGEQLQLRMGASPGPREKSMSLRQDQAPSMEIAKA